MAKLKHVAILIQLMILAYSQELPIVPRRFRYVSLNALSSNGSSLNASCSDVTFNPNGTSTCNTPSSSVLFDGHIPTLSGLDGDTWANELTILHSPPYGISSQGSLFTLYFDFMDVRNVGRVEVTIFNCPELQTIVHIIYIYSARTATMYVPVVSCDSLVKMCIPVDTSLAPVNRIFFARNYRHVHIAEIAFYQSSSPCPYITMIPGSPSNRSQTDPSTTLPTTSFTPTTSAEAVAANNADMSASSNTQTVLSVLSAITALQTAVILIVVVAVIFLFCMYITRCRAKSVANPAPAVIAAMTELSAEDEMYETVEPGEQKFQQPKRKKNNPYTKQ